MPTDPAVQLDGFIDNFTPEIAAMTRAVIKKMRKLYPTAQEVVYDNYNALAIGFWGNEKMSSMIFSIAVYPRWVSLFFLQAKGVPGPQKLLKGSGSVAKHIVLQTPGVLDDPAIVELMATAVELAKVPFAESGKKPLIIKSISAKQRPRRPVEKAI